MCVQEECCVLTLGRDNPAKRSSLHITSEPREAASTRVCFYEGRRQARICVKADALLKQPF